MADKKLTPEDLRSASGGASKETPGASSEKLGDSLKRLRNILDSDDDFSRVRYANLTEKELSSVLGAGANAIASALAAHGVKLERKKPGPPQTKEVREDAELGM